MYIGIFASYVLSFVFLVFVLVVLWVELSYFLFSSMTSHHEKSLTMFSIAFMVLVFVLTQTVSHSFPKLCVTLQRNFGTDAAYRASRYVFRLSQSRRITTNGTVLGSAPVMRRHLPNREVADCFGITHRT
jgi:hypothetical protein